MRILWLSNSAWAYTGYGNQTRIFVPRIKSLGYDIGISAFYGLEGGILNMEGGIPVFPKFRHPYGQDIAAEHAKNFKADVIISLIDAWVCEPENLQRYGHKWIPWFPVDSEPLPPPITRQISKAYKRIVFSRFAEQMVKDAGMDCYYAPHGCDTQVFRPIDRVKARETMRLPADKFLVGMVAANKGNAPSRKAFVENIAAFKELRSRRDDVMLYIHTATGTRGDPIEMNLVEYCESLGLNIGSDVRFPEPYQYTMGFPDEGMVELYNAFDVLLSVSMGEGFGIPILEAQACGCPVIVGDWTAMGELCFSGWKVNKADTTPFWTSLAAYQYLPHPAAIAERLEMAYRLRGNPEYRERARRGALKYDADRIAERYWKPVLADIEANLKEQVTFAEAVKV